MLDVTARGCHCVLKWRHCTVRGRTYDGRLQPTRSDLARLLGVDAADGVVYYLLAGPLVKIGHTVNLADRLRKYGRIDDIVTGRTGLRLLALHAGTRADEVAVHADLRPALARGREWFTPTAAVIAHVDARRADLGLTPCGVTPVVHGAQARAYAALAAAITGP